MDAGGVVAGHGLEGVGWGFVGVEGLVDADEGVGEVGGEGLVGPADAAGGVDAEQGVPVPVCRVWMGGMVAGWAWVSIRWARVVMVGVSKMSATRRSVCRVVLVAAIRRIADRESPPRSKKESAALTRSSTPRIWA